MKSRCNIEHSPQNRLSSPDEVANFINGVSLNVDAGKLLGLW